MRKEEEYTDAEIFNDNPWHNHLSHTPAHPIDQLFHDTRIGPHTRRTRTRYTR